VDSLQASVQAEFDRALGIVGTVQIEGDGDIGRVCDCIEDMLVKAHAPIYQRGGMLVRVVEGAARCEGINRDAAAPRIVPFDDLSLVEMISRHIAVERRNRKTSQLVRVDCPRVVAQTLLARHEWVFPVLEAVVEHPVMLADGSVLWESGYDESTGLLLRLPLPGFLPPEDDPSDNMLQQSLDNLTELLSGFSFVDDLDLSVALAFLLTAFVRPVIPTSPGFAIDAHAAGSGKSTLVQVQSRLATGRAPAFLTYRDDPAELQKTLFAALLEGDQYVAIDNVDQPLGGADLAVMLTSPIYRGRVLGQSVNASVPTKAVISFNGNNLQICGDLTRRVLVSRIDAQCERPAERSFDFDPIQRIEELRIDYISSALTIMSAYARAPDKVQLRPFGSFEDWSRLVREPLVWMGLPDPVDALRHLEAVDPERMQLRSMLQAVSGAQGHDEFKAAALIQAARSKGQAELGSERMIGNDEAGALAEALHAVCERNGELNAKALGRWLLRVNGRIDGGLRFVPSRQTNVGMLWRVQRVG
jgi:putative DNA primase/helicase